MKSISEFKPRAGAIRFQNDAGEYQCANPHDPLYSTVTMSATEYWNGTKWIELYPEQHVETVECGYCQGAGVKVALVNKPKMPRYKLVRVHRGPLPRNSSPPKFGVPLIDILTGYVHLYLLGQDGNIMILRVLY